MGLTEEKQKEILSHMPENKSVSIKWLAEVCDVSIDEVIEFANSYGLEINKQQITYSLLEEKIHKQYISSLTFAEEIYQKNTIRNIEKYVENRNVSFVRNYTLRVFGIVSLTVLVGGLITFIYYMVRAMTRYSGSFANYMKTPWIGGLFVFGIIVVLFIIAMWIRYIIKTTKLVNRIKIQKNGLQLYQMKNIIHEFKWDDIIKIRFKSFRKNIINRSTFNELNNDIELQHESLINIRNYSVFKPGLVYRITIYTNKSEKVDIKANLYNNYSLDFNSLLDSVESDWIKTTFNVFVLLLEHFYHKNKRDME